MGRYTDNDNRSMQMNPNNERYYSSRGYDDDCDDDCDDDYEFNLSSWKVKKEKENIEIKKWVDDNCISLFGKKVFFKRTEDRSSPVYSNWDMFYKDVLNENDNLKEFKVSSKEYKGLTVNYKSFKDFFKKNENVKDTLVKDILEVADRFNMEYLYFKDVYVSKNYMFFKIDLQSQGYFASHSDYTRSWHFSSKSCNKLMGHDPEVVYEDFEDVFTCKKYLIDK